MQQQPSKDAIQQATEGVEEAISANSGHNSTSYHSAPLPKHPPAALGSAAKTKAAHS